MRDGKGGGKGAAQGLLAIIWGVGGGGRGRPAHGEGRERRCNAEVDLQTGAEVGGSLLTSG